jgi:hypothetical protein
MGTLRHSICEDTEFRYGAIVPVSKGPLFPIGERFRENHAIMLTFKVRRDRDNS